MTLAEILEELPTLTIEERNEILQKLDELDVRDHHAQGDKENLPPDE